jgi:hypothetical protein
LSDALTDPKHALTYYPFIDLPLKPFEVIEISKVVPQALTKNHLKLTCVAGTNIEMMRNGLQIHQARTR